MRLRSDHTDSDGSSTNFPPDQSSGSSRGRRFKLPKFLRGQRPRQAVVRDNNTTTVTDGQHSPQEEEPQNVILTFKQALEEKYISEASRLLIEREEHLFREIRETAALKHHEEEVENLAEDYKALDSLILQTLKQSFMPSDINTDTLTSAVNAINQEEDQDQLWKQRDGTPPAWRPRSWRKVHDSVLRSLVEEHMDNPLTPPADQDMKSSIQVDINSMGRQLKEDLLWVVEVVKRCYPPELDICNFYARLYHQSLSARIRKISEFVLAPKDCTFLLRWVNEYYPEILQKTELSSEINAEALGKLLPTEMLVPLEEQYLSIQQDELVTYIGRVLEEAKQKWTNGEEPTREYGCFVSPLAYDIIQLVNGMVTSAAKVVADPQKAQNLTCQLPDLMERFRTFHNDIIKQNKPNSRAFIKANLGCIEQFSDVLHKKSDLFPQNVQKNCLHILSNMRESAHAYLLKPVHAALKPHYRKLGTNEWLNTPLFEGLLASIENELHDLQGLIMSCHQMLVGQLHQEVSTQYVTRLLKGEVKLKDKEQQLKAYMAVKDNAESLHDFFVKMGSKKDWLKEILTKIAEVLKLQDLPAIQMQVVSLGTAFPDLSEKHVSALLKLKTNFPRAHRKTVKETLSETLSETSSDAVQPFFSAVQIK